MFLAVKIIIKKILQKVKIFLIACLVFSVFWVVLYRFVNPPVTPLMLVRVVQQVWNGDQIKMDKKWVPMSEISHHMKLAVVASEDQKFLNHHGFDFDAIKMAWKNNAKKKKKTLRGGSTISQQVAKNAFLWQGRSWPRKALEAYFTVLIELLWSKERILEVYLNIIETGIGIYGVEAIAQASFNKSASNLSRDQSALIAAVIPNPLKWSPAKPTYYITTRKVWIVKNMGNIGKLALSDEE
jgi:monofunctional glycosyltransferase